MKQHVSSTAVVLRHDSGRSLGHDENASACALARKSASGMRALVRVILSLYDKYEVYRNAILPVSQAILIFSLQAHVFGSSLLVSGRIDR